VRSDEVRRRVLEAVERGHLPRGGPSELAARDLIEHVPAGYWAKWTREAAKRIRRQASRPRCTCAVPLCEADAVRCECSFGYPDGGPS